MRAGYFFFAAFLAGFLAAAFFLAGFLAAAFGAAFFAVAFVDFFAAAFFIATFGALLGKAGLTEGNTVVSALQPPLPQSVGGTPKGLGFDPPPAGGTRTGGAAPGAL